MSVTPKDDVEGGAYPSTRIREQLKSLGLLLAGAVMFAFLMGILANTVVGYFVISGFPWRRLLLLMLVPAIGALGLAWILYYYYVFVPNARLRRHVRVLIIYDMKAAAVIDDPFDGYFPQKLAWQAFSRLKKAHPETTDRIRLFPTLPRTLGQKHVLTELCEYITVLQLHNELPGLGSSGQAANNVASKLPSQLEQNSFVSFFRNLESEDIVDRGMQQLGLDLPEDVHARYWSPWPPKTRSGYHPDTFRISLVGKSIEVNLTGTMTSMTPVGSMTSGPAPVFEGMFIRPYWETELLKRFPSLRRVTFHMDIDARFRLRFGLFPNLQRVEWAESWIDRFVKGGLFGGFDFDEFRRSGTRGLLQGIYQDVQETRALVEKLTDSHDVTENTSPKSDPAEL